MNIAKFSISRPIATTMVILVFLLFGIIGYFSLNINLTPEIDIPYVTISTMYPGAGPKEIENQVTKVIEDVVSTISKIERVESYSLDGMSIVILQFKIGKNVDVANQEVKDKVDQILYKFPADVKKPIIQKIDFKAFPVVDLVLSGNLNPRELWIIADKKLKDRFSQIEGVASVNISGGQEREIRIKIDNRIAYENSISLPQLLQILKAHNMDIPGGFFQISDQEFSVRLKGELLNLEEIKELEIPTLYGPKKIRQFADVSDTGKDIRQRTILFDLKRKYTFNLAIQSKSNTQISKEVLYNEIKPTLSSFIQQSLKDPVNTNFEIEKDTINNGNFNNITLKLYYNSVMYNDELVKSLKEGLNNYNKSNGALYNISITNESTETVERRDGNVVRLGIVKAAEGNVVKVAQAVKDLRDDILNENLLPPGCKLEIVNDESEYVKSSVNDTLGNVVLGVIITALILLIFLHDLRSTLIVALTMPTSIISTFFLLKAWGLTLNMMTLMGLSVTVGVLVANSIVVLENIFRYKALGETTKDASYKGTKEVTLAVLASTSTNLVVFLPLANMSSIVGQYLKELALTATFATIFSLIMSFTLTPMLASLILPKVIKTGWLSGFIIKIENKFIDIYRILLRAVLKNKLTSLFTFLVTIFLFILVIQIFLPKVGGEFMPTMDDGQIKIEVELPQGYNLDATAKVINEIENRIGEINKKDSVIKHTITDIGKLSNVDIGTNMARMDVQMVDVKMRNITIFDMISKLKDALADIPNAKIKIDNASQMGEGGAPITFYLLGQDVAKLEEIKLQVIQKVKDVPGLINFDNSSRSGKPEITLYPKREILSQTGLTVADLAYTLRSAVEGIESSKYRELGEEYDLTVTMKDESVSSPEKIANITVVSPYGGVYRMAQLADIKFTEGYSRILHRDKYIAIQFSGSNAPGYPLANVTNEVDKRLQSMTLPGGYSFKWGGSTKMMNEMFFDLAFAFILAIILTYMLMAALLESFIQPLYIMGTIVMALIGIIPIMAITKTSFNITSIMGIIMLIGIVVNNAILLLDFTNQIRREEGKTAKEALLEAGPMKLKPQIMSAVALMLGMLPMALGIGDAGKEMRTPLGIVSIAGLAAATVLTVFVIPAIYMLFSRTKKQKKHKELIVE